MAMTPRERYAASALVSLPTDVPPARSTFAHLPPPPQRPAAGAGLPPVSEAPAHAPAPPPHHPPPSSLQHQQPPPLPPPPPPMHEPPPPVLSSCAQAAYATAAAAVVTAALASAAPALARLHVSVAHVRLASDSSGGVDTGPPVVWLDGEVIDGVHGVGGGGGGRRLWGGARHDGAGGGGADAMDGGAAGGLSAAQPANGAFGHMGSGGGRIAHPPPLWRAGAPSPGVRFSPTSDLWLMSQAGSPPLQPGGVFSSSGVSAGVLPTPSAAGLPAGPFGPAVTTPGTVAAVTAAAVGLDALWPRAHHRQNSRAGGHPPAGTPPVPPVVVPTGSGDRGDGEEERGATDAAPVGPGGAAADSDALSKRPSFWTTVIPGGRSARVLGTGDVEAADRAPFADGGGGDSGAGSRGGSNSNMPPSLSVCRPPAAAAPGLGMMEVAPPPRQGPYYMPLPSPFPLPSPMTMPSPMGGAAGTSAYAAREWGRPPTRGGTGHGSVTKTEKEIQGAAPAAPGASYPAEATASGEAAAGRAPSGAALPKRRKTGSGGRPPTQVPPAVRLPTSPRGGGDRPTQPSQCTGGLPPPAYPAVFPTSHGACLGVAEEAPLPVAEGGPNPAQTPKTALYSAVAAVAAAVTADAPAAGELGAASSAAAAAGAAAAAAASVTSSGAPSTSAEDGTATRSHSTSAARSGRKRPPPSASAGEAATAVRAAAPKGKAPGAAGRPVKAFPCALCGVSFGARSGLTAHTRSVHERLKPYSCNRCDARFAHKGDLSRHCASRHERLRPFVCGLCGADFSRKSVMTRHVAKGACRKGVRRVPGAAAAGGAAAGAEVGEPTPVDESIVAEAVAKAESAAAEDVIHAGGEATEADGPR
ncbi:hypothetical protein BU14_1300s0001 [Porphyra umbilicalis]|uniref:C2H2-type domain-containing protein n=1 Tax=Porphyra umbilicalis TaxID=2786 RepID=A0A1X6NM63_PORUM|nr:hypothetical protein BU14_1300s0001 [Porphyra umbilicalis]|eukprot:OSX69652.1 hypothetical protein BU14_1300s0001 [Porphyra umbilicalis]